MSKTATVEYPYSLDDLTKIKTHDILVEKEDLQVTAQHTQTLTKVFKALELNKEDGKLYLKLPKLYSLSVGEQEDIGKITINRTRFTIAYQELIADIAHKTHIEPKLVRVMLMEAWKYEDQYPIFRDRKEIIVDILSKLQSTEQGQAEVTIAIKSRLIEDWTSMDTERLGGDLYNKIREYVLLDSNGWKPFEAAGLTEEDKAFLEEAAAKPLPQLAGGEEEDNPTPTLNLSSEALTNSEKSSTIEVTAQAS